MYRFHSFSDEPPPESEYIGILKGDGLDANLGSRLRKLMVSATVTHLGRGGMMTDIIAFRTNSKQYAWMVCASHACRTAPSAATCATTCSQLRRSPPVWCAQPPTQPPA
jgi:hypothetical protein